MKTQKIIGLSIFMLALSVVSCSKDDDGTNDDIDINTSNLIGSWRLVKEIYHEAGFPDDIYNVPEGCNEEVLTFTNTEITAESDYDCDGSVDETNSGSYTLNGNSITSGTEMIKIQSLTASTLRLRDYESADGSEYDETVWNRIN